jgi:hypothetical protein
MFTHIILFLSQTYALDDFFTFYKVYFTNRNLGTFTKQIFPYLIETSECTLSFQLNDQNSFKQLRNI